MTREDVRNLRMSLGRGVGRERGRRENNVNIVLQYKILKTIKYTQSYLANRERL